MNDSFSLGDKEGIYFLQISANKVKQLIHQLSLLHFRDIDNDFLSSSFHPAGFGVGAAAAGEYQKARVCPIQGIDVSLELSF